jgi:hydroxypyruvate isomerase
MKRRDFLHSSLALGATAGASALVRPDLLAGMEGPRRARPAIPTQERLKQSVTRWTHRSIPLADLAAAGREMGLQSIELLNPDEWPVIAQYGLTCAVSNVAGPGGIPRGFNRIENHEWLIPANEILLRQAADAGVPNVICFSGNRAGLSDEEGLENCARGLERLVPLAEQLGVTLVMELLNSKVDHRDYMCDHTPWGVALVERIGSDRMKLLYDIYHMQIMEGDVIRTIRTHHQHIAHYHTAGVPGRNELDETQELYYPAIVRAIRETGYEGFLGQEFIPRGDPIASLRAAVELCDV